MAAGNVHGAVDDLLSNRLMIGGLVATPVLGIPALGLIVAGTFSRFTSPDLDLHHVTTENEHKVYRFNWLLGLLWELYWTPYAYANRHRGRSHTWLGTIERFFYLYWLSLFASLQIAVYYPVGAQVAFFWLAVLIGHAVVDSAHVELDNMRYF